MTARGSARGCQTATTIRALAILRQAVSEALERKRRLGQYAVVWQDGRPVRILPDAAPLPRVSDPIGMSGNSARRNML